LKPAGKIWGTFIVLVCLIAEVLLLKEYKYMAKEIALLSAAFAVFAWSLVWWKRKTELLFVTIFNAFKAGLASVLGLILIVHVIIHLGFIGTDISNYIDKGEGLYQAFISLCFLCIPFFILPLFAKKKKYNYLQPEILIATLSFNKSDRIRNFIENQFDETLLNKNETRQFWNWLPVLKILTQQPSIKKLYLLVSQDVMKEFAGIEYHNTEGINIYRKMLDEKQFTNVALEIVPIKNPVDFIQCKAEIEQKLHSLLADTNIPDEKLLFDLTGGTAVASIVMVLLAFTGKRRAVYQKQEDGFDVEIIEPDVQNIRELWQQILENL
jgi:hypothetical protein